MSETTLSFDASSAFRDALIARNLPPYGVPGAYSPPQGDPVYEATPLSDSNVIDSPNDLVGTTNQANELYPLNQFGPDGGFNNIVSTDGPPLPVNSNQGEYGANDADIEVVNEFYIDAAYVKNTFGPQDGYKDLTIVSDLIPGYQYFLPYYDLEPLIFLPSQYTPLDILISDDPSGSNGLLSQDSFLAQIAAGELKFAFNERVKFEEEQILSSIVNLDSLQDPFEASLVATGQQPLIGKNWKITVPENPLLAGVSFLNRITGTYFPVSFIPGDYFNETEQVLSPQTEGALNVTNNLTGGALGSILNKYRNPSELFLANTGFGQKSVLFKSLDYNRYRPKYNKGLLLGVTDAISNLVGANEDQGGGYYVGSDQAEPSRITSPDNEIPVDAFGKQQPSPVYGPSELGKLYEGNIDKISFGLGGKSYTNQGGIAGEFIWTSPKYKDNLGFKVEPGGNPVKLDEEFNVVSDQFNSETQSDDFEFKQGSILDNTQRLIESADSVTGQRRLQHVGNAINQISKVFNDGYKEMTKGSQVIAYYDSVTDSQVIGESGFEVGREYCRVFQKDTPYLTYADLQKTDGITNSGRGFTYSVFDNTYNLNIAPLRNPGSTNIIDGKVKKYMFSLENLAWRTSDKPGYTYDDLPACERGPNGGRIMWFPPYNLTFSDSSTASWNPTSFLGRPEPIYTYKDTKRSGNLSWSIVVDHPAMMNTIIEKQLANLSQEQTDSIMDSFFAGCVKYDLYDLAIKFNTLSINELYTYQELLQNPRTSPEEKYEIHRQTIGSDGGGNGNGGANTIGDETGNNTDTNGQQTNTTQNGESVDKKGQLEGELNKFVDYGFYFDNDYPIGSTTWVTELSSPFVDWYNRYITQANRNIYDTRAPENVNNGQPYSKDGVQPFFDQVVIGNFNDIKDDLIPKKLKEVLVDYKGSVTITLRGSASAPATNNYNINLSKRRNSVVLNWLRTQTIGDKTIKQWEEEGKIKFEFTATGEDVAVVGSNGNTNISTSCTNNIKDVSKGKVTSASQWYSVPAMACRRVKIEKIKIDDFVEPPKRYSCDGNGNCYEDENGEFETLVKCKEKCTPQPSPSPVVNLKTYDCINGNCVENTLGTGEYTGDTCNEQCGDVIVTAITTNPQPTPTPTIQKKIKEGISKKVLRTLFSECDYFEIIKESNPTVYASIKDKIKYFSPAFHSITPEGLNARLTFLNQCVRPGQTIPVIGPDGKPKYNDARNTSFGAPPVLVLRVGDFYHTKIIPNQLSITYEPLLYDINPEGIGIQPMIAKISLGFDFIGGHGLAGPVQELQNALSFNFYANTEIYDERSTPTESTKERDENLVQQIITKNPGLSAADTSNENDIDNQLPQTGGNTIGNILTEDYFDDNSYQTGTTEFNTIFNQLSEDTNSYFTTIFNQLKTINEVTNYPILQLVSEERNFQDGNLGLVPLIDVGNGNSETKTKIFGKPIKYENKITKVVNQVLDDINDNTNPLIEPIENSNANYSKATKREFKNKVYEIVSQQDAKINERIINYLNEISNSQQEYVQIFKKMDLVVAQIDGYRLETGKFKVYSISPKEDSSDSLQNIRGDIYPSPLDKQLTDYLTSLENNKIVYADTIDDNGTSFTPVYQPDTITIPNPTGPGTIELPAEPFLLTNKDRRFYMVMSDIFTDDNKYNTFVESIITERVKGNTSMVNLIKQTCESIRKQHLLEFEAEKKLFTDYETSQEYIDNYLKYKINNLENTSFEFNYTTQTNSDTKDKQKELKTAYSDLNTIKKKNTFNGKVYFD
jgi:hypothetical protein